MQTEIFYLYTPLDFEEDITVFFVDDWEYTNVTTQVDLDNFVVDFA
jgi:hypothetical protein